MRERSKERIKCSTSLSKLEQSSKISERQLSQGEAEPGCWQDVGSSIPKSPGLGEQWEEVEKAEGMGRRY